MKIFWMPLAWLYHLVLFFRHLSYDTGLISSRAYAFPVICVGNLSLGGTGKTPHIEYLIRLLKPAWRIATLSRGYGRITRGYLEATPDLTASEIGDEPRQFASKFPDISVAVDERRVRGIQKLRKKTSPPEIVLLDDAFQHRKVKAGLNLLLTDYHQLYSDDFLFPAGQLRDTKSSAKRAQAIIVTKTPAIFSPFLEENLRSRLKPKHDQLLFFSYIKYGGFVPVSSKEKNCLTKNPSSILLVTGIANAYPLKEHLGTRCNELVEISYPDHHAYTEKDFLKISNAFGAILGKNKLIVTTEKDAMRFKDSPYFRILENLPLCYVPIEVAFHQNKGIQFDEYILDYVRKDH